MTDEQWLPIPDFSGYQISNYGRVLGKKGTILKPGLSKKGYLHVCLHQDGLTFNHRINRLVATAFIGPAPSDAHEANHKNGIKVDNHVDNLEWLTRPENIRHSAEVLRSYKRGAKNPQASLTEDQARALRDLNALGTYTAPCLAEIFGVSATTVLNVLSYKRYAPEDVETLPAKPLRRLTDQDAREIRELFATGKSTKRALADKFEVSLGHIYNVIANRVHRDPNQSVLNVCKGTTNAAA